MIRTPKVALAGAASARLRALQAQVDAAPTFAARRALAKRKWDGKTGTAAGRATFDAVKEALNRMCCGARRCTYCEDSCADEIEHMRPKAFHPEHAFRWSNYVYACGRCNGPKGEQTGVLTRRGLVELGRAEAKAGVQPPTGRFALIDPRREDPLAFLFLDLEAFVFTPLEDAGEKQLRAEHTLRVLRLNDRDALIAARKNAFGSFRARLKEYAADKTAGAKASLLRQRRGEILDMHHQTVFAEMKRQRADYPELGALFAAVPEALTWRRTPSRSPRR